MTNQVSEQRMLLLAHLVRAEMLFRRESPGMHLVPVVDQCSVDVRAYLCIPLAKGWHVLFIVRVVGDAQKVWEGRGEKGRGEGYSVSRAVFFFFFFFLSTPPYKARRVATAALSGPAILRALKEISGVAKNIKESTKSGTESGSRV